MKKSFSFFPVMLLATFAQAGTFDEFSETLIGFQCELEKQREFILIGEIDNQLRLLSPNYSDSDGNGIAVSETQSGYRFLVEDGITVFLSNLSEEGWTIFYATETGPVSTNCIEVPNLPLDVANAIFASVDIFSGMALDALSKKLEDSHRENMLLTQQVFELREQLDSLQSLVDDFVARDAKKSLEIESLSKEWYSALARIAALERQLQAAN